MLSSSWRKTRRCTVAAATGVTMLFGGAGAAMATAASSSGPGADVPKVYADGAIPSTGIWSVPQVPGGGQFRVGWFIKQDDAFGLSGDDRGFDPAMGPQDNRVYLELDYERGLLMIHANPTCDADEESCTGAVDIGDHVTVESGPGTLVVVKVDVPNSRRSVFGHPRITGNLTFSALGNEPCVVGLFDRFPSVEVYHDQNGLTTAVWTRNESKVFGPSGLSPLTVVNMNSCD